MDGGVSFVALALIKLGAVLGATTGLISFIKWFNSFEYKYTTKKKGGNSDDGIEAAINAIGEKAGSKSKIH